MYRTTRVMPIMTGFKFGDVVLVPFPFTDQSAAKKRPAVVISSETYHQERPDLIIMTITSQMKPAQTVGEAIVKDWQGARLLKPSVIKPVITTIERGLIIQQLGQLSVDDQAARGHALVKIPRRKPCHHAAQLARIQPHFRRAVLSALGERVTPHVRHQALDQFKRVMRFFLFHA